MTGLGEDGGETGFQTLLGPVRQFQPELVGIVAVLKQDVIDQRAVLGLLPEDQGAVDLLALLRAERGWFSPENV